MNTSKIFKELRHHAYLIFGRERAKHLVLDHLTKHTGYRIHSNPDFFQADYDTFVISDARDLKAIHITLPVVADAKKIFVILFNSITIEAQNALLKLLEEPAHYARFIFIAPKSSVLLPTVLSRMQVIEFDESEQLPEMVDDELSDLVAQFVESSLPKRLDIVKNVVDLISSEKQSKAYAVAFMNELEGQLYKKQKKSGRLDAEIFAVIDKARNYMKDRAPSIKMLLEFVAFNV